MFAVLRAAQAFSFGDIPITWPMLVTFAVMLTGFVVVREGLRSLTKAYDDDKKARLAADTARDEAVTALRILAGRTDARLESFGRDLERMARELETLRP